MKGLFSRRFYLDTLIRIRTLTIVFAAVFAGMSVLFGSFGQSLGINFTSIFITSEATLNFADLLDVTSGMSLYITVILPIISLVAFSFLTKRSESDFYEALPISRESMLLSGSAAVLTSAAITITAASVFGVLFTIPSMGDTVFYDFLRGFVQSFGLLIAAAIVTMGVAVAISVTGTSINAWFTAMVILLAPRLILLLINNSVEAYFPALVSGHIIPLFDNNYNLFSSYLLGDYDAFLSPWAYIYSIILVAVYTFIAEKLCKKRYSEFVAHSFTNTPARHFISITFAVLVSMLGIYVIFYSKYLAILGAFLITVGIGLYFAVEAGTGRRENNFISTVKALPVLFVILGVITGSVFLSSLVFKSYSPERDEIESVSISFSDENYNYGPLLSIFTYGDYVTLRSDTVELTDESVRSLVSGAVKRETENPLTKDYYELTVKIDTGTNAYRKLRFTYAEYEQILNALSENEDYQKLWLNLSEGAHAPRINGTFDIGEEGTIRVLTTMEKEIAELGFEKWYQLYNSSSSYFGNEKITYSVRHNRETYTVYLDIFEQLPKTYDVYLDELQKAVDAKYESIKNILTMAANGERPNKLLNAGLYTESDYYVINTYINDSEESREFIDELFSCVASEAAGDNTNASVYFNVSDGGIFSDGVTGTFAVPGDKVQQIVKLFKKYGLSK